MKKSENIFQKMFAGMGFTGSARVPLRSNIFGSKGYSTIGSNRRGSSNPDTARQSPLLGTAQPSNRLSGFYDRVNELKTYQLLDISKMATNLFRDYLVNFLIKTSQEIVTIQDEDGNTDQNSTNRLNEVLTKDLKILDYIQDHLDDSIFFGTYGSMLVTSLDELGHHKFRFEELHDPVSVVIKRKKNIESGVIEDIYLAKGDDGGIYEIPRNECFCMGATSLRLINDLQDSWENGKNNLFTKPEYLSPSQDKPQLKNSENREKVLKKESYLSGEPLFYSNILKVKELIIKELLVSLISLRDLSSPTLFGLALDKAVPVETANELCAKTQKMATNYSELASFMTANFDATSFIESALTQNIKVFPDYNGSVGSKNAVLPLDKLSDKLIEVMQTVDQCRNNVLTPLGIPGSIYESAGGSKWAVLQQSERANSRVASLMAGIRSSIVDLACSIYRTIYGGEIDPSLVKVHIFEKSSVEYNNQINQTESISSMIQGISTVLQTSLQVLDSAGPLFDAEKYTSYIQTILKDIDPSANSFITEETMAQFVELQRAKVEQQKEQIMGGGM